MSNIIANILARGALALGYDAAESSYARRDLGWGRSSARDEDHMADSGTRETLRQRAADLRRNTMLAGVCDRIGSFVVGSAGLQPQARTSDKGWNKAAEEFWHDWSARCDVRGRASLWQLQTMAVSLRPTHGGLYLQLLDNGQVRPIECERIRDPWAKPVGDYVDGVKVDKATGRVKGYLVHARDDEGGFAQKHDERYIEAENIIPVVRPPWRPDQVREVPDLAAVATIFQDIVEANKHALTSFKVQNSFTAFLKRVGGLGPRLNPAGTNTVGSRQTFRVEGGTVLEGQTGDDLQLMASPTPASNHIPYIQFQLGFAAAGINFPYEFFTLDFSHCDFSRMKAVLILINKTCHDWQRWLSEPMQRLWNWRIAKAIKDGDLAPAPKSKRGRFMVSEWSAADWQGPEELRVDRQQDNQADMLEWQMGLGTMSAFAKRRGADLEDLLRQKADDLALAGEIEKEAGLPAGTLIKVQIPGQTEKPDAKPAPAKDGEE